MLHRSPWPFATVVSLAALVSGHSQAKNVCRAPAGQAGRVRGALPDRAPDGPPLLPVRLARRADSSGCEYGVAIPGVLSFLVHGDTETPR